MPSELRKTSLCFLFSGARLLLIQKLRGQGEGFWNVPGGKLLPEESFEQAAVRETHEETGFTPEDLKFAGQLEFIFPTGAKSWSNVCKVFTAHSFSGSHIPRTPECTSFWHSFDALPFEKFWPSDRVWIPKLLAGEMFSFVFHFDSKNQVISSSDFEPC